jgi:poly(3-hydroxybutyrate) depolymerase
MNRLLKHLFLCCAFFSLAFLNASAFQKDSLFINVNGGQRNIIMFTPNNVSNGLPLMIVTHGMNQNATYQYQGDRLYELIDSERFIIAYLNSSGGTWDIGGSNDLNYVNTVVDYVDNRFHINRNRLYWSGFSMGSMLIYHAIRSEIGKKFAAFAPCSGVLFSAQPWNERTTPVNLIHCHAYGDDVFNYNQYGIRDYVTHFATLDNANNYHKQQNVVPNAAQTGWVDGDKETWTGGTNGSEVELFSANSGGHWPTAAYKYEIWNFCKRFSLDGSGSQTATIANFDYDKYSGRYRVDFNDLTTGGSLQFDKSTGNLTLPAGQQGTLTLTFNGADFSNVSKIKVFRTGDDLFNTLTITNAAGNSVNSGGAFYTSKYDLNYTGYQANSSAVNTLVWYGNNETSAAKTMTLQEILINVDVMRASKKHERQLMQSEFGVWNSIAANATRTGDDSDMEYNIDQFIGGYGTIYGNGNVRALSYADLSKYGKLRIYGDDGLYVRALFNRVSDTATNSGGGYSPDVTYTDPANLNGKTFAIVRNGSALYGTDNQNAAFAEYETAFTSSNTGYLFKAESVTVNGGSYYRLRLITPQGGEYSIWGSPGYLNANGWCCFILGLNDQNGQDLENGAVWDIKYVAGQGMTLKNVGTGNYLTDASQGSTSPAYWTLCTIKEGSNDGFIEKAGNITDGVFEIDLASVGQFAHMNALKVGGGSGTVWSVTVTDESDPMDYYITGKYYIADNLKSALSDLSATNYDATGLTNSSAVALNTANKNALIYVNNASKLSNSANVVVKNGDSYSSSNIVLIDGMTAAQTDRPGAYFPGGSVKSGNATWADAGNGSYAFHWSAGTQAEVQIFNYIIERQGYNHLVVETTSFTKPWGVRFYDVDGNKITEQGYWAAQHDGNLIKDIDIDALFAANGVSNKRSTLTMIRLYNISDEEGEVVVKASYLCNSTADCIYPFYAPYDIAAASAKLTTSIPEEGFTTLTTPFAASMPSGFTSYALLEDNVLTFDRIDPNAPMVVKGSGNLELTATNTTVKATNGLEAGVLKGTYTSIVAPAGSYVQKEATRAGSFSPIQGVTFYQVAEGDGQTVYPFHAYATGESQNNNQQEDITFDPNFHIYLCFGQSNMEGNAAIEDQDRQYVNPRFKMMAAVNMNSMNRTAGQWYTAYPPLCREWTGLTPADYFGRTMVENLPEEISVGVINVAVGGCSIELFDEDQCAGIIANSEQWFKNYCAEYNNNPFRTLVNMAKEAQKAGVIKGILLHQGCSNNSQKDWPVKVKRVYLRLLQELGLEEEETPLLIGETLSQAQGGVCWGHNNVIAKTEPVIPNSYVISSAGCPGASDGLHFTAQGYRMLGQRYAETMLQILDEHHEIDFDTSETYFPLTEEAFNPMLYLEGTFQKSGDVVKFNSTDNGNFGGWRYHDGIDLSAYNYIVVKLNQATTGSPVVRVYDTDDYLNPCYTFNMGNNREAVIDLRQMKTAAGATVNPAHLYMIGFENQNGKSITFDKVFLSMDGVTDVNAQEQPQPDLRSYTLTVTEAGVSTLYLDFDALIPDDADFFIAAAVKRVDGTTAYLKRIKNGIIPANTGVMIFANPGNYVLNESEVAPTEIVQSALHGVTESTSVSTLSQLEGGAAIYVLSRGTQEYTGFKVAGGTVKTIPAYKAYLPVEQTALVKTIYVTFDNNESTDIQMINNDELNDAEIFDLSGRKVSRPQKGIYIINGRKVLIK